MHTKYPNQHTTTTLHANIIHDFVRDPVNSYFVETGTNLGAGVDLALQLDFRSVISIEKDQTFFEQASAKFKDNTRVRLHLGDSRNIMPTICQEACLPCFFWLDAHYTDDTESPLFHDLSSIVKRNYPHDIIAIDDIRLVRERAQWGAKITIGDITDIIGKKYHILYTDSRRNQNDILIGLRKN